MTPLNPPNPSNPSNPFAPATRDALQARLRFYRDLGIGEFYRREVDPALWAQPDSQPASPQNQVYSQTPAEPPPTPAPLFPQLTEETEIAPRKPFPAAPARAEALPPEQHFAALKLIREEIGDCTRCDLSKGRNKIVFGDGDPVTGGRRLHDAMVVKWGSSPPCGPSRRAREGRPGRARRHRYTPRHVS